MNLSAQKNRNDAVKDICHSWAGIKTKIKQGGIYDEKEISECVT